MERGEKTIYIYKDKRERERESREKKIEWKVSKYVKRAAFLCFAPSSS